MIRIFRSTSGHKRYDNMSMPVSDYIYNVYLFGILIHSVTIKDVSPSAIKEMFKEKKLLKEGILWH